MAKRVFEATVKNTKVVVELVQKSGSEAPKIIIDRMRALCRSAGGDSVQEGLIRDSLVEEASTGNLCCSAGEY